MSAENKETKKTVRKEEPEPWSQADYRQSVRRIIDHYEEVVRTRLEKKQRMNDEIKVSEQHLRKQLKRARMLEVFLLKKKFPKLDAADKKRLNRALADLEKL